MATARRTLLEHLRRMLPAPDDGLSDGQLLARFVATRDEAAFAALVRRHQRLVLGVCRRLLGDHHDVEDCFQATFFVLVRKAGSVVKRESVSSWLYGVAYRTALEARTVRARRRAREKQVEDLPHPTADPDEPQDWRPLLDRELAALPEKYREVVILCELEGRTRRQVAGLLGLPEGTVSSRLAAARQRLARRLARRGLALSAGAFSAAMAGGAASAALPAATAKAAALLAAGEMAAGAAGAVTLTQGVLKAMLMMKLKTTAAALVIAAVIGMSGLAYLAGGEPALAQDRPKGPPDVETLRKENELLKLNLQLTLENVQALEAEVHALKAAGQAAKAGAFETGWDKPVDPDGDCKFIRERDTLTIEVPGKDHDLAIERGLMNTPRLLRDVDGDFVAQVRVSGTFIPSATSTSTERIPFTGAGLVLMADDKTYIRLERAALRKDGEVKTYANWELREGGEWVLAGEEAVLPLKGQATYLRLERRGNKILGSVSEDGKEWSELKPLELKLPAKLKVGVSGGGTSTDRFKPHFDRWRLTGGDKKPRPE